MDGTRRFVVGKRMGWQQIHAVDAGLAWTPAALERASSMGGIYLPHGLPSEPTLVVMGPRVRTPRARHGGSDRSMTAPGRGPVNATETVPAASSGRGHVEDE